MQKDISGIYFIRRIIEILILETRIIQHELYSTNYTNYKTQISRIKYTRDIMKKVARKATLLFAISYINILKSSTYFEQFALWHIPNLPACRFYHVPKQCAWVKESGNA